MKTTIKLTEREQQLKQFALSLKEKGFPVAVSCNYPFKWIYIETEKGILTIQQSYLFGFSYSSVYKPSEGNGTGVRLLESWNTDIETLEKALKMPFTLRSKVPILFYDSLKEFMNHRSSQFADYYLL